jgi:hypothetical protein
MPEPNQIEGQIPSLELDLQELDRLSYLNDMQSGQDITMQDSGRRERLEGYSDANMSFYFEPTYQLGTPMTDATSWCHGQFTQQSIRTTQTGTYGPDASVGSNVMRYTGGNTMMSGLSNSTRASHPYRWIQPLPPGTRRVAYPPAGPFDRATGNSVMPSSNSKGTDLTSFKCELDLFRKKRLKVHSTGSALETSRSQQNVLPSFPHSEYEVGVDQVPELNVDDEDFRLFLWKQEAEGTKEEFFATLDDRTGCEKIPSNRCAKYVAMLWKSGTFNDKICWGCWKLEGKADTEDGRCKRPQHPKA